ncbi:hypothetical protein VTN49DRAFT_497 [Thermomyces lanuginosus]|uniref:uncharacterized protein n=1 Tax=Thermomyces lanuginosus TaxID=5541 RepID=UPI0037442D69
MSKIGIFPASGGLGSSVIRHLTPQIPAANLVLIARYPDKLAEQSRLGATVRRADYDDPTTLTQVFEGIGALFLISYASCEDEHRITVHKRAIDEAVRNGVKHIFYSSLAFAGNLTKKTSALVMRAHLATEAYLEEIANSRKDFTYTIIREGLYSESYPIYTAFFDPRSSDYNEILIPHDGSAPGISWAKRDELGEATANLIAQYARNPLGFPYQNRTLLLTGPKIYTLQETVDILGRYYGREGLRIKKVSVEEYATQHPRIRERLTYHGKDISRDWATAWKAIEEGETAVVTPTLGELLGREPEDFETTTRKAASNQ